MWITQPSQPVSIRRKWTPILTVVSFFYVPIVLFIIAIALSIGLYADAETQVFTELNSSTILDYKDDFLYTEDPKTNLPIKGELKTFYTYPSQEEVAQESYDQYNEDLTKRTDTTQTFINSQTDQRILRVYSAPIYTKQKDTWYRVEKSYADPDVFQIEKGLIDKQILEKPISFWSAPNAIAQTTITTNWDDTTLLGDSATTNNNTYLYINIYSLVAGTTRRGFIQYTMPADPDDTCGTSTINKVELFLRGGSRTYTGELQLYQISRTDTSISQATWNVYKTASNWATAGAMGAGDYVNTIIDSAPAPAADTWTSFQLLGAGTTNAISTDWNETERILLKYTAENVNDGNNICSDNYDSVTCLSSEVPYVEITYTPAECEEEEATTTPPADLSELPLLPLVDDLTVITGRTEHWETSTTSPDWYEYHYYRIPFFLWYIFYSVVAFILGFLVIEIKRILKKKNGND